MKNIHIIRLFIILAILFTGCTDEYGECLDNTIIEDSIMICVKCSPYNSLEFHTEISKYEYGNDREILLEGDLNFFPASGRRPASHQIIFIIHKEDSPELYNTLLGGNILFVVESNWKMKLMFKSDVKIKPGINKIEF